MEMGDSKKREVGRRNGELSLPVLAVVGHTCGEKLD
jgi:hypothetical protein